MFLLVFFDFLFFDSSFLLLNFICFLWVRLYFQFRCSNSVIFRLLHFLLICSWYFTWFLSLFDWFNFLDLGFLWFRLNLLLLRLFNLLFHFIWFLSRLFYWWASRFFLYLLILFNFTSLNINFLLLFLYYLSWCGIFRFLDFYTGLFFIIWLLRCFYRLRKFDPFHFFTWFFIIWIRTFLIFIRLFAGLRWFWFFFNLWISL